MPNKYKEYIEAPTASLEIHDTQLHNVRDYASAQVIDTNLLAENIKNGVTILGITGTYTGE